MSPVSNHQKENTKYTVGSTIIANIKKIAPHIINLLLMRTSKSIVCDYRRQYGAESGSDPELRFWASAKNDTQDTNTSTKNSFLDKKSNFVCKTIFEH